MIRRAAVLSLALALLAAGCGERDEPADPATTAPTSASPSEDATPDPLPGASCDPAQGGSFDNVPDFVEVEVASDDGVDRIVFRFEPRDAGATEPPSYAVRFVDELVTDGEGAPADVEGEAFVQVNFNAVGVDLSSETPVPIYTGPNEFTTGFETLVEAEKLGDFESIITWGLGLSFRACPRITASATEITLEFPA